MEPLIYKESRIVISAGGNPTGVFFVADAEYRKSYGKIAEEFAKKDKRIEQVGFMEGDDYFQMAGGEFCVNGTCAAAFVLANRRGLLDGVIKTSGFDGRVEYQLLPDSRIRCLFRGLRAKIYESKYLGVNVKIIDLGGITHVVLPKEIVFKNDPEYYKDFHKNISNELRLADSLATGVIWVEDRSEGIAIYPVVSVPSVKTISYETACGSASIALLIASDSNYINVIQPTGKSIEVFRKYDDYIIDMTLGYL